ncbi:MAG: glycosyltransferase family 4 protein [Desulfobacterales bacterium]|nr:MAG: glycosyltransferase family 4 protein [Desulfobacterales bacterium]
MNKLAIVVQRAHSSVVGGSEAHAWQYARLLQDTYQVEVLTTTALDEATWDNALPAGSEQTEGITIRRFKVTQGRTLYWHALHERLLKEYEYRSLVRKLSNQPVTKIPWTLGLQEEFIRKQGPYSEGLLSFLGEHSYQYQAVIFLTYLFPTTYFGIAQCQSKRSILVPTLHDEPPAYFSAYARMARKVRSVLWNTSAERKFGSRLWGQLPGRIVGMAVETHAYTPDRRKQPYLLYCGRIDPNKGCDLLIDFFLRYKRENPSDLQLVFTGKAETHPPTGRDIDFKGFVSREEKFRLMAGAKCFVMPSPYESLSIVTLEAMAQRTPVLVNGSCEVLKEHVERSGGGLFYQGGYQSFANSLRKILASDPNRLSEMGAKGRDYVASNYSPEYIKQSLIEEIERSQNFPSD